MSLLTAASSVRRRQKIFPYPYVQEDLPNGLRLITIPTDYPNIVSLFIVVGTGSRNEVEPGKSGFAHLFEHLMFRGTAEFPPEQYQAELQNAGAASNAFTTDDLTAFHTTFSKEDLPAHPLHGGRPLPAPRLRRKPPSRPRRSPCWANTTRTAPTPTQKLFETLRATAFKTHTYQHTTMGFLEDIQAMPDGYDYSRQFFDRYYRPEYTTIIVAGDVDPKQVRSLVDERWGNWKRGSFKPQIPAEPPQDGPRTAHVDWPSPTLPLVAVAWRGPAYSDDTEDTAALDAISRLGFDQTSPLYQKLVIEEQKVDRSARRPAQQSRSRILQRQRPRKESGRPALRRSSRSSPPRRRSPTSRWTPKKLEALKQHLRYEFALQLE